MDGIRKEDAVQAVLIADSYEKNFQPFIRDRSAVRYSMQSNDLIMKFMVQSHLKLSSVCCRWSIHQ